MHRSIPDGFTVKQVSVTKKADGQFVQFVLEDANVPTQSQSTVVPTWDNSLGLESLTVDRDVNAAINLKRLGLDIFPSIKRRSGKLSVVGTMDESTTKEILHARPELVVQSEEPTPLRVSHPLPSRKRLSNESGHAQVGNETSGMQTPKVAVTDSLSWLQSKRELFYDERQ